jgi:hypothetical protein
VAGAAIDGGAVRLFCAAALAAYDVAVCLLITELQISTEEQLGSLHYNFESKIQDDSPINKKPPTQRAGGSVTA